MTPIAKLFEDIYLIYYRTTKKCGIRTYVEPGHFFTHVLTPGLEKLEQVGTGFDVVVGIDDYHDLVLTNEDNKIKAGIVPISMMKGKKENDN
jgi:hypothetical protein